MKALTCATVLGLSAIVTAQSSVVVPASTSASAPASTSTCIVDTVLGANTDQVEASINSWFNDVVAVNSFLNTAPSLNDPAELQSAAQEALTFAQDEPCQLMTLTSTTDLGSEPPTSPMLSSVLEKI